MAARNEYIPPVVFHPGETLAEKLQEMAMGPKEFALRTGKPEKTITAVLKGGSSITPDMAVQFEVVTKIPAHFWMNHQKSYDEYIAREKRTIVIQGATDWAMQFPIKEMMNKGWIEYAPTMQEKTVALLSFFSFANQTAWEDYYCKQKLKVAFRISLARTNDPFAISAWLRKGELQAAELSAKAYSEKKFKDALPEIRSVMINQPRDFLNELQRICLRAGVKVVHTPSLPKAAICGSARWLNDTPLIQLTDRDKPKDTYWFTFFHEAGHILLHGKKDVFLEKVDYSDKDKHKELEADQFASRWLS